MNVCSSPSFPPILLFAPSHEDKDRVIVVRTATASEMATKCLWAFLTPLSHKLFWISRRDLSFRFVDSVVSLVFVYFTIQHLSHVHLYTSVRRIGIPVSGAPGGAYSSTAAGSDLCHSTVMIDHFLGALIHYSYIYNIMEIRHKLTGRQFAQNIYFIIYFYIWLMSSIPFRYSRQWSSFALATLCCAWTHSHIYEYKYPFGMYSFGLSHSQSCMLDGCFHWTGRINYANLQSRFGGEQ